MVCERKKEEAERELAAATEALEGLGVEVDELRQELDELRQEKEEQQEEMQVCMTLPSEHPQTFSASTCCMRVVCTVYMCDQLLFPYMV